MAEKVTVDFDKLRLRDVEDFEEASGVSMGAIQGGEPLSAKALSALVWITKRLSDPNFTLDDARDMEIGQIEFVDEPNPTEGDS